MAYMEIILEKELAVVVEYEYTPPQVSHDWYTEDLPEELYITDIEIKKGTIVDLMMWGNLEELERKVLEKIKEIPEEYD